MYRAVVKKKNDKTRSKGVFQMQSLVILAQDIPWVMAPASLIAAIAIISITAAVIRLTQRASKVMMLGVMIALTVGVMLMQVVQ
jgi:hypothetical protein